MENGGKDLTTIYIKDEEHTVAYVDDDTGERDECDARMQEKIVVCLFCSGIMIVSGIVFWEGVDEPVFVIMIPVLIIIMFCLVIMFPCE